MPSLGELFQSLGDCLYLELKEEEEEEAMNLIGLSLPHSPPFGLTFSLSSLFLFSLYTHTHSSFPSLPHPPKLRYITSLVPFSNVLCINDVIHADFKPDLQGTLVPFCNVLCINEVIQAGPYDAID